MALLWDTTIRGLMIKRGIKILMPSYCAFTVYKGMQPTSAEITSNWINYKTSTENCLAHYLAAVWTQQPDHGQLLSISTLPTTIAAYNSGEASWAIIWMTNILEAAVAANTLPSVDFMVVPCSNSVGKGVMRYQDPLFVSGVSKQITEASLSAIS